MACSYYKLGVQKRGDPILVSTPVGDFRHLLLGRPEAFIVFLRILWSFKTSDILWEPEIWQNRAVIYSGVEVSGTDAFRIIHQGPVCRAFEGLRSRFPWERQLIGKYKNVEISLFPKRAYGGFWGGQLVTEAGGSEVSTVSERATSTRSLLPVSSSGSTQNLRPSEWLS
jgi:hypothetical protein